MSLNLTWDCLSQELPSTVYWCASMLNPPPYESLDGLRSVCGKSKIIHGCLCFGWCGHALRVHWDRISASLAWRVLASLEATSLFQLMRFRMGSCVARANRPAPFHAALHRGFRYQLSRDCLSPVRFLPVTSPVYLRE